ncbi:hypothetical protein F01_310069 [Burkholderia cenocepacia]|nr:hypothetical protein F01_310069 [Burkholderia cenocepacia]
MQGTRRMAGRGGSGPPHVTRCNDEDDFLCVDRRARMRGVCAGRRGRDRRARRQYRDVRDDRPGHHGAPLTGGAPRARRHDRRSPATRGLPRRVAAVQRIMADHSAPVAWSQNNVPTVPRAGRPRPHRNRIPLPRRAFVRELRRQGAWRRADEVDRRGRVCVRGRLVEPLLRDGQRRQHPFPASDPGRQSGRAEGARRRDGAYQHAHPRVGARRRSEGRRAAPDDRLPRRVRRGRRERQPGAGAAVRARNRRAARAREICGRRAGRARQDRRDEAGRSREGHRLSAVGAALVAPRPPSCRYRVPIICSGRTQASNSASVR